MAWRAPKSLLVCEQRWRVRRVPMAADEGQMLMGRREIQLADDVSPEGEGEVFLHELLHALWRLAGLNEGIPDDHEERVVTALASGLFATLKRNGIAFR